VVLYRIRAELHVEGAVKYPRSDSLYPLAAALADVCGWDMTLNRGRLFRDAKSLAAVGATPEDITARFGKGSWWYKMHWLGKQGQMPTPAQVRENWRAAEPRQTTQDRAKVAREALYGPDEE